MHFKRILGFLCGVAPCIAASISSSPLSTSGRWIVDSGGNNVTYAGVNWPGAADAMLPEGLQYQSIEYIIDDIIEGGADVSIKDSITKALGDNNGTAVFQDIVRHNSQFKEVFDAVANECYKQGIYVHLDNHVSKATWCCSTTDSNAWFGDKYFNVKSLPAVKSIGMRNELRSPDDGSTLASQTYNWQIWYQHMVDNANQVHEYNPDLLIFFSGLNYDVTLSPIPTASDLGNGTKFKKTDFSYADKIVLELHNYASSTSSCDSLSSSLLSSGYNALDTSNSSIVNVLPVVMTEFGFKQDNTTYNKVYASSLRDWLPKQHAGWLVWVISGSYYIRSGLQDADETWGLVDHTWSDWRSTEAIENGMKPMVQATLN